LTKWTLTEARHIFTKTPKTLWLSSRQKAECRHTSDIIQLICTSQLQEKLKKSAYCYARGMAFNAGEKTTAVTFPAFGSMKTRTPQCSSMENSHANCGNKLHAAPCSWTCSTVAKTQFPS
jgi:hypothetical protein